MNKIDTEKYQEQVKNILEEYYIINASITNLELEIAHYESIKEGYKSIDYSAESGGKTNKISSPVEKAVIETENKICELRFLLSEKSLIIKQIDNALDHLEEQEKEIVKSIYIRRISAKATAKKMSLSQSAISKLKRQVILKISKMIFL
ncbi:MAG: sigma factor-like helix-turn-helix DNA-binding protein [Clostridium sp.]